MKKKIVMLLSLLILVLPITVLAGNNDTSTCPLGPDVTKDLYGVLMILKIVAPLLCVGLSIFDAIQAITKGDPASDLKPVAQKFMKRMIYAIILFFLPVLVDLVFQIADVWGANGSCNLMDPESNGQPSLSKKTTVNCANIKYEKECEKASCSWNSSSNTCYTETVNCANLTDEKSCEKNKCKWNSTNNTCYGLTIGSESESQPSVDKDVLGKCADITDEKTCKENSCDWNNSNNTCHSLSINSDNESQQSLDKLKEKCANMKDERTCNGDTECKWDDTLNICNDKFSFLYCKKINNVDTCNSADKCIWNNSINTCHVKN